jgi:Na+/H+ antiporter NhaD/arsenite permease-like protein
MFSRTTGRAFGLALPALALLARPALAAEGVPELGGQLGRQLGLWTLLPFVGILLAIALLPLVAARFWEHNKNKGLVALLFAAPIAIYLIAAHGGTGAHTLLEKAREYASFMALLASLFVITGGIYVRGSLSGTPLLNTAILGIGAVIANVIGTTGASVLLIRPLLRANAPRERTVHVVVFFMFIVSNCGGLLTPLGDPPLFLGYLKGVPFDWTLRLWKQWALVNGLLLMIFNIWDQIVFDQEERERPRSQLEEVQRHEPLRISGGLNFVFLAGVMLVILAAGRGVWNGGERWPFGIQEGAMLALTGLAFATTKLENRALNQFSWGPIVEVAVLFAGIFVTMAPALAILNAWGSGEREVLGLAFGLDRPWQFFWSSGLLSSFLDNAPTYMTFAATAAGIEGVAVEAPRYLGEFLLKGDAAVALLAAVSCGSVMMGANSYIGNGPNFMVKAIAEENGVKMPSFFGYMAYSCGVLLPVFLIVTLVFFR